MAGRTVRFSLDPHLKRWLGPFFLAPFCAVSIHDGDNLPFHPHPSCEVLWNLRGPIAPTTCAMAIGDHPTPLTPFQGMVNRLISTQLHMTRSQGNFDMDGINRTQPLWLALCDSQRAYSKPGSPKSRALFLP